MKVMKPIPIPTAPSHMAMWSIFLSHSRIKKHYLYKANVFCCLAKVCFLQALLEQVNISERAARSIWRTSLPFLSFRSKNLILLLVILVIDLQEI